MPDSDGDGLTALEEQQLGTNPNKKGTDNDGMNNGWELDNGFDPLNSSDCSSWICDGLGNWRHAVPNLRR